MSEETRALELAIKLNKEVKQECANNSGDGYEYIKCLLDHSPENLEDFIGSYIDYVDVVEILGMTDLDDEEIDEFLENTNNKFWKLVKEEYENLWLEDVATAVGEWLAYDLDSLYHQVIEDDSLTNGEKVYVLQRFKDLLEKLVDIINNAIESETPLSSDTLRKYLADIARTLNRYVRDDYFEDYLDYYSSIPNKEGLLKALSTLNDRISYTLDGIDEHLEQYNSQRLTS